MNVHWTEAALADLQAVETYIARHSPPYAASMVERIFAHSERLEIHPRLDPVVSEYDDETLRELFEDPQVSSQPMSRGEGYLARAFFG